MTSSIICLGRETTVFLLESLETTQIESFNDPLENRVGGGPLYHSIITPFTACTWDKLKGAASRHKRKMMRKTYVHTKMNLSLPNLIGDGEEGDGG